MDDDQSTDAGRATDVEDAAPASDRPQNGNASGLRARILCRRNSFCLCSVSIAPCLLHHDWVFRAKASSQPYVDATPAADMETDTLPLPEDAPMADATPDQAAEESPPPGAATRCCRAHQCREWWISLKAWPAALCGSPRRIDLVEACMSSQLSHKTAAVLSLLHWQPQNQSRPPGGRRPQSGRRRRGRWRSWMRR